MEKWTSIEFYLSLLEQYQGFGLLAPILLTMFESLVPALPLVGIVLINVGAFGPVWGFITSWIGTTIGSIVVFYISRKIFKRWFIHIFMNKNLRILKWISRSGKSELFLLTCVAFTPSSLINIAYGLSDFNEKDFVLTLMISKFVMTLVLAVFGTSVTESLENPLFLLLAVAILAGLIILSRLIKKRTGFEQIEK